MTIRDCKLFAHATSKYHTMTDCDVSHERWRTPGSTWADEQMFTGYNNSTWLTVKVVQV